MPKIKLNKKSFTKKVQKGGEPLDLNKDRIDEYSKVVKHIENLKNLYIEYGCGTDDNFNNISYKDICDKIINCGLNNNNKVNRINKGSRTMQVKNITVRIDKFLNTQPIKELYNLLQSKLTSQRKIINNGLTSSKYIYKRKSSKSTTSNKPNKPANSSKYINFTRTKKISSSTSTSNNKKSNQHVEVKKPWYKKFGNKVWGFSRKKKI